MMMGMAMGRVVGHPSRAPPRRPLRMALCPELPSALTLILSLTVPRRPLGGIVTRTAVLRPLAAPLPPPIR